MNQIELIRNLAQKLGKSQVETKQLLDSSIKIISDIIDQDIPLSIPNLGTFNTHLTKKRKSFSPFHNQYFIFPPKRIIKFRPSISIINELKTKKIS